MNARWNCHATRIHGGKYVWVCSRHLHLGTHHIFVPVLRSIWPLTQISP